MSKFLRYEDALKSPVYHQIVDDAWQRLADVGAFSKQEVLEATRLTVVEESIRWEYIKRMLEAKEEAHNIELIPVALAYFKRHKHENEVTFPGRYIATGNGKKTAGYVLANPENGHFVTYRLGVHKNRAAGIADKANRLRDVGDRRGIEDCHERNDLSVSGLDRVITPPARQIA